MNEADNHVEESAEGRALAKRNDQQDAGGRTQSRKNTTSRLLVVREAARKDRKRQFTNLMHHISVELLKSSYYELERRSAPGMDGIRWEDFQDGLEDRLEDLHRKIHTGSYRPKPARRAYIPKDDGSQRTLSVICLEDKIVQQAVVNVLNCIYEVDFLGFSYGFRPGRNQHTALDALHVGISKRKVNWVLDLDISKFFDTVEHDWLIRFIGHRIRDRRLVRLIRQWLKVGVLDEHGHRKQATVGTPQGAVISPLLANVYLHYVFDLWVNKWRKQPDHGEVIIVRYADDVVAGFQRESEAKSFRRELEERLAHFGLRLHPEKTRLIRFGRFAMDNCHQFGRQKPETFDFLGFTHYCGRTRGGYFYLKRKTSRVRLRKTIKAVSIELRRRMHDPPREVGRWLRMVIAGHLNYFGVPFNSPALRLFVYEITRRWYAILNRRSQRKKVNWKQFAPFANHWLPAVRIVHPYPEHRFIARTRSRSRMR